MPSPPVVLPGVLFVGEDERARVIAHLGPAAGWFVPRGIGDWSTEVSVVPREALTEEIRRTTKTVMPEEQIPPAKYPMSYAAAQKAPLLAVASRLAPKLVEAGVRVHTIGVDRITSSFYYLAEGGGEDEIRIEGDLVASVGAMLGERADNASIERVLDGLVDRLVRAMSKDRVTELSLELAAQLPRAAADGTGMQGVDLDAFEGQLAKLVGESEKYASWAREIADKVSGTTERRLDVPLFTEAKKVSMGPFDLEVGTTKVTLPTYERWTMSNPLTEPSAKPAPAAAKPAATAAAPKAATPAPAPAATTPRDPSKPLAPEDALANLDAGPSPAEKAAAERAAALKAASEKAAAEKKAAEAKAAAEKKAAEEKAAAEKKAAEEKAAAEKAEAEKKAAEEKAAAEKAEAEKKAAEEKAAAEKAEAEKKAAAEKAEAEKKAAEAKKDDAEPADEKKADDKKADEKKADEKKAAGAKKSDGDKKAGDKKPAEKKADALAKDQPSSSSTWIFYVAAAAAAAFAVWKFLLH